MSEIIDLELDKDGVYKDKTKKKKTPVALKKKKKKSSLWLDALNEFDEGLEEGLVFLERLKRYVE